jgi:tricorn protease
MHLLALVIAAVIAQCPNVLSQTKLLRHPDVHGDRVVCTYGGDLWHAPVSGGTATRLTSTPGVELFAKFSPDGRCIAFTGQANGNEQVCIVPSEGGDVRQLTWYPSTGPLPARWGYGNEDKQLQKAVDVLLEQIKNDPPTFPTAPPAPVKTGR